MICVGESGIFLEEKGSTLECPFFESYVYCEFEEG